MDVNQLALRNIYEHKATISLFSWKIRVYGKKTKQFELLNSVDLACDQIERRLRLTDLYNMQNMTKRIR